MFHDKKKENWQLALFLHQDQVYTVNTLRTGDADLRFYITTVQDGWRKSAFLTHVVGLRPATSCVHYTTSCNTQSSAPEDGQNNFPKHVELTGIINKPLSLHLVGCLYYLYQWCTIKQISDNEIYLLIIEKPSLENSETPVPTYRTHGA